MVNRLRTVMEAETQRLLQLLRTGGFWYRDQYRYDATPWDINNGCCEDWAEAVASQVRGAYVLWLDDDEDAPHYCRHCVIDYRRRYYDADCLDGVDDVMDLPILKGKKRPRGRRLLRPA